MAMTKRERYIGIVTLAVVGILVLDRIIVTPLMDQKTDLDAKLVSARDDLSSANRLFATSRRLDREWRTAAGHSLKNNESEAESQILNSIGEWVQYSGISMSATKRERTEKDKEFVKISYRATATGSMRQVGEFLWKIQTATIPVRITDISINSRKDGTDDLAVQMGIATVYLPAPPPVDNSGSGARSVALLSSGGMQ
jgi:hypothetical protein